MVQISFCSPTFFDNDPKPKLQGCTIPENSLVGKRSNLHTRTHMHACMYVSTDAFIDLFAHSGSRHAAHKQDKVAVAASASCSFPVAVNQMVLFHQDGSRKETSTNKIQQPGLDYFASVCCVCVCVYRALACVLACVLCCPARLQAYTVSSLPIRRTKQVVRRNRFQVVAPSSVLSSKFPKEQSLGAVPIRK